MAPVNKPPTDLLSKLEILRRMTDETLAIALLNATLDFSTQQPRRYAFEAASAEPIFAHHAAMTTTGITG